MQSGVHAILFRAVDRRHEVDDLEPLMLLIGTDNPMIALTAQ